MVNIDDILAQADRALKTTKTESHWLKLRSVQVDAMMKRYEQSDITLLKDIIQSLSVGIASDRYSGSDLLLAVDTLEKAYCIAAFWDLELYFYALEFRRKAEKRYYEPRRNTFRQVADAITDFVIHDKYDILVLNCPPRTGKSTMGILACTWAGGRQPDKQNVLTGYASALTDSFYKEINSVTESEEYNYGKIFRDIRKVGQSAERTSIDYTLSNRTEMARYPTFACRAVGGSLNGQVEAANLLYCDDLTRGYEEATSIDQMDKLYAIYTTDLIGRAKEGFKQFHIGTRWSIHDPLGRIIESNKDNPRFKLIQIPALDPIDDESNFVFDYNLGFSTEFYKERRKTLLENEDSVSWECLYQQNAIERGSLVFPETELTWMDSSDILEKLPIDEIYAFVDVAFGGADYLSMPIAIESSDVVYIVDWLYLRGDYKTTEPLVYSKIRWWGVDRIIFEANNGGEFYAKDVERMVRLDHRGNVFIAKKLHTGNQRKVDRIEANAPDIKKFVFFKDLCYNNRMYRDAIRNLTTYSRTGTNKNDDAPDSLAGLAAMRRTKLTSDIKILSRKHI